MIGKHNHCWFRSIDRSALGGGGLGGSRTSLTVAEKDCCCCERDVVIAQIFFGPFDTVLSPGTNWSVTVCGQLGLLVDLYMATDMEMLGSCLLQTRVTRSLEMAMHYQRSPY